MSLELSGVGATYQRRPVFANVDLHAGPGDIVGLIGPNGAGKTTLLRIAAGLIRPSLGTVERSGPVMYFGGESTMPGRCRADKWARLFRTQPPARRRIARLSRGTRQLLGLAAFFSDDEWAIGLLDEPWEGLDPAGARWLTGALRRHQSRGATLIVSSHRLHDAAEICSAYGFLANGAFRPMALEDIARGAEHVGARELARAFDDFTRG